ncbi:hypothetical protein KKD34_01750 [bacterium]|nr:hypothetical protein [bacterium]
MKDTVDITDELRERLKKAVGRNPAEGLLFSGGLDTSILAVLNPNMNPAPFTSKHSFVAERGGVKAITVSLESFGEDVSYAKLVANHLKLNHYHRRVSTDEAIDSIPDVIKILKSFDPAIPNDLVVYFGLKWAKELGIKKIMTGDGSDELFAGYDFMRNIRNLDEYLRRITKTMSFSSNQLGDFFDIKIKQPFLNKRFIDFSLGIPVELKIKEENGNLWGKWILRKAFEKMLPAEIVWQDKRPLEYGSGMRKLRKIITSKISDEEFEHKSKQYPIKFMNKEHLYYYEIYKKEVGEIPGPKNNQKECPGCGAGMEPTAFHCKVCGYVCEREVN